MSVTYYSREKMLEKSKTFIKPCNIMIDVGCGIRPYFNPNAKIQVCIEPFKEYIDMANNTYQNSNIVFINDYAVDALKKFPDNSVDTVVMLDLIEHLEKKEGYNLIKESDRITKKQIVIFTPLGFMPNHREGKDAWGLNGQKMQEHKSGWLPEDFDNSWEFHVCENFHLKEFSVAEINSNYGCLWAIKNKNIQPKNIAISNLIKPELDLRIKYSQDEKKIENRNQILLSEFFRKHNKIVLTGSEKERKDFYKQISFLNIRIESLKRFPFCDEKSSISKIIYPIKELFYQKYINKLKKETIIIAPEEYYNSYKRLIKYGFVEQLNLFTQKNFSDKYLSMFALSCKSINITKRGDNKRNEKRF